jgi:hypothetical protein
MASWKDGEGQYTWGKYNATGDYSDIYIVGGSSGGGNSDYFYISEESMNSARQRNYGTGIHFWRDGNKVNITINLLLISADSNQRAYRNGYYVGDSSDVYKFFADIQYQTKSGDWVKLGDNFITENYGGMPLFEKSGWDTQNSGYLWKTFTYDLDLSNITQFSIGIHGENTKVYKWNYYKVEKVFKPEPKPTGTLIVNYINQETNEHLKGQKIVENLEVGTKVTEEAVTFTGYTVNSPFQSITIRPGNNGITFLYNRVKQFIRPWAIRKSGTWRSLQTLNTRFKIRKSGTWKTMPDEDIESTKVGQANYSPSRIRKSGTWKAQGKVGS